MKDLETDPDKINEPNRQIEAKVFQEAQAYAKTREESKELNKQRAESRETIKNTGVHTLSYQFGIRITKDFSPREQKQIMDDLRMVVRVLGPRQQELWPEEALRIAKREEDRKRREAEAKAAAGRDPDHPRSDPKSGGAGKTKAKKGKTAKESAGAAAKAGQAIIDKGIADREQTDGAAALSALMPDTEAAKVSQSAQARAILEETGLDKLN